MSYLDLLKKERKHDCTHVVHNQFDDPLPFKSCTPILYIKTTASILNGKVSSNWLRMGTHSVLSGLSNIVVRL